jgi:hypothetical protein
MKWLLFVALLAGSIWQGKKQMDLIKPVVQSGALPNNIVPFEKCFSPDSCRLMTEKIKAAGMREQVQQSIRWDFLFLFFYAGFLAISCYLLGEKESIAALKKASQWMMRLALFAGLMDIAENLCMQQYLNENYHAFYTKTATICANIKFSCIYLCVVFLACMLLGKLAVKIMTKLLQQNRS